MKRSSDKIHVVVYGFTKMSGEKKAKELAELLFFYNLPILKYDMAERAKHFYTTQNSFIDFWTGKGKKYCDGSPFIKGKDYYAIISRGGGKFPYLAFIVLDLKHFSNLNQLLDFAKDFYLWNEASYGYVCLDAFVDRHYSPGMSIIDCLPDITWANFFGKPYVDMWGESKIANAPAYQKQKLSDSSYLLLTSEVPETNWEIANNEQEAVKQYLGTEYFCNKVFTRIQDPVLGVFDRPDHKKPDYEYVAPDFSKYYDLS